MSPESSVAILGGLIGSVLGVVGSLVTSYYGTRKRKTKDWFSGHDVAPAFF